MEPNHNLKPPATAESEMRGGPAAEARYIARREERRVRLVHARERQCAGGCMRGGVHGRSRLACRCASVQARTRGAAVVRWRPLIGGGPRWRFGGGGDRARASVFGGEKSGTDGVRPVRGSGVSRVPGARPRRGGAQAPPGGAPRGEEARGRAKLGSLPGAPFLLVVFVLTLGHALSWIGFESLNPAFFLNTKFQFRTPSKQRSDASSVVTQLSVFLVDQASVLFSQNKPA